MRDNIHYTFADQKSTFGTEDAERRLHLFWRITIVFIAVTLVWLVVRASVNAYWGLEYTRTSHMVRAVLTSLVIIPLIVSARRFLDRRAWTGLSLSSLSTGWRPLLIGMICWLIPAAIGITACAAFGWTDITLQAPPGNILILAAGLMVLVFFYEALPEELIFRGYFYRNLSEEMPRWLAVLGQAVLFVLWGLANGGPISLERSILFFTAALIIGVFRVITGSVWASIGFHLAFQTTAQLFGTIGNQFVVSDPQTLSLVAFGVVPFALSITILRRFYKSNPGWTVREPDTDDAQPHQTLPVG